MKKLPLDAIEKLAEKFRADNDYSQTEPIHTKTILRQLGILAVYRPLSKEAHGMSLKAKSGHCFMLINSNNSRGRQHFTIAHELFHLFIDDNPIPHICSQDGYKDASEKNADLFASALLMPRSGILKMIPTEDMAAGNISLSTILRIEQYYGVSRSSLLYRLKDLKLIKEQDLNKFLAMSPKITAFQYGYDTSLYQNGNTNLVIGDFGEKARMLFENGKISEGHYRELLNMISNGQNEDSTGC